MQKFSFEDLRQLWGLETLYARNSTPTRETLHLYHVIISTHPQPAEDDKL